MSTFRKILIIGAIWGGALCAGLAHAEESGWGLEPIEGRAQQVAYGYLEPFIGAQSFQDRLDAEVALQGGNDHWRARLVPWGTAYAPLDAAWAGSSAGAAHFFGEIKEGWLEYRAESWDLRLGNQIISWGAADKINPTDLWNPVDMIDLFNQRKLPLLTARATFHPDTLRWLNAELLFAPFFRESRLPIGFPSTGTAPISLTDSPWLSPLPNQMAVGGITVPLNYQLAPALFPQQTWQGGARVRLEPGEGWDFTLSYLNSVERLPRFYLTTQGDASNPALPMTATLYPSYHREQVFGVDGAGAIFDGAVTLRFEAAYHLRDNSDVPVSPPDEYTDLAKNDQVLAVAGFDYTLPWRLLGVTSYVDTFFVFYQEVGSYSTAVPGSLYVQGLPNPYPWDRDWVFYLENRFSTRIKLATTFVWSVQNQDFFLSTGPQARIDDHFGAAVEGDFFLGNRAGFFGQFSDVDRVRVTASYVF